MPPIPFPVKLWEAVNSKDDDLIRWSGDGREVLVFEARFTELIDSLHPSLLRQPTLFSLRRLLRWYDFVCNPSPDDKGTGRYFHPLFTRGHPEQVRLIVPRIQAKRGRSGDGEAPRDQGQVPMNGGGGLSGSSGRSNMFRDLAIQQFLSSVKMSKNREVPAFDHRDVSFHWPENNQQGIDDELNPTGLSSLMEFSLRRFPGLDIDNVGPPPVVNLPPPTPIPSKSPHQLFKVRLRDFSSNDPVDFTTEKVEPESCLMPPCMENVDTTDQPEPLEIMPLPCHQLDAMFGVEENEPWFGLTNVPVPEPIDFIGDLSDPCFSMSDFSYTNLLPVKNEDWQLTDLF